MTLCVDLLEQEIQAAIRKSMKELNILLELKRLSKLQGKFGPINNYNMEPEGLEAGLENLSYEEQLSRVLALSRSEVQLEEQQTSSDDDEKLQEAIAKSLDPSENVDVVKAGMEKSLDPREQENQEHAEHFRQLQEDYKPRKKEEDHIPCIDELDQLVSQGARPKVKKSKKPAKAPSPPPVAPPPRPSHSKLAASFNNPAAVAVKNKFSALDPSTSGASRDEQKRKSKAKKEESEEEQIRKAIERSRIEFEKSQKKQRPKSVSPALQGTSPKRPSTPAKPAKPVKAGVDRLGKYRPIIIDGCNVAYQHGKNQRFSSDGLLICYNYFKAKGFEDKDINIFIKHVPKLTQHDKEVIESLETIDVLYRVPSRSYEKDGKRIFISSDDDLMILECAKMKEGTILSRDHYRDSYDKRPDFRTMIENRLIQPTFVGDDMILPEDPLGPGGPSLDEFLRF